MLQNEVGEDFPSMTLRGQSQSKGSLISSTEFGIGLNNSILQLQDYAHELHSGNRVKLPVHLSRMRCRKAGLSNKARAGHNVADIRM